MSAVVPPTSLPVASRKKEGGPLAAANAAAASFAALTERLDYLSAGDIEQVRRAYRYADEAHLGQLRNSGEPYITHPIAVAVQCTDWKLDAQALMAALLHDAMEDCGVTKTDLIERFGAPVAELVDGLTKLDRLQFHTREENQAESFRKMLLAMARDVRVILIKLADRTHNMRTMGDMPRSKWARISAETLEIYAPIAHRLGLNKTYRELQDLSFRYLRPWRYAVLSKAVGRARNRRRDLIQKVRREVEAAFASIGMKVRIAGREKSLYSIYRKMDEKHLSFAQVTDIYGFRVIVPTVTDCYTALGVLHQMYKPVPGRFKDYIAIAKLNGYQSLHTTLVALPVSTWSFRCGPRPCTWSPSREWPRTGCTRQQTLTVRQPDVWGSNGCSRFWTSRMRPVTPRSSGTTLRSICSRTRFMSSPRKARSWPFLEARRWWISPMPSIAMSVITPLLPRSMESRCRCARN